MVTYSGAAQVLCQKRTIYKRKLYAKSTSTKATPKHSARLGPRIIFDPCRNFSLCSVSEVNKAMPLDQTKLKSAALRRPALESLAFAGRKRTAFLCHSHHDKQLAEGLQVLLQEQGLDLYIDWKDGTMPATPDKVTAQKIQSKIQTCDLFIFLATANSKASRWCPWEIGYANGKKTWEQIAIAQTTDGHETHGNEYLQLYRRLDAIGNGQMVWVAPGSSTGTYVRNTFTM
jgi:hypothetical protein